MKRLHPGVITKVSAGQGQVSGPAHTKEPRLHWTHTRRSRSRPTPQPQAGSKVRLLLQDWGDPGTGPPQWVAGEGPLATSVLQYYP